MSRPRGQHVRTSTDPLDDVADGYVRLVLALQRHNPNYLDAYFGPPAWRAEARRGKPRPVRETLDRSREALGRLQSCPVSERREFLERQLVAVESNARTLSGERLSWEETLRTLLDAEPMLFQPDEVAGVLKRLDDLLPGRGPISARHRRFLKAFEIPKARLRAVVEAAVLGTRARTRALFSLPPGERTRIRLVRKQTWAAYTWYLGRAQSTIDINLDSRHHPEGLLNAIAHEAYPGHHTFLSVREHLLVRGKGWREHSVSPLVSPQSLISEGAGYMALDVIMGQSQSREYVREVLAPKAGVPHADLDTYFKVNEVFGDGEFQNGVIMEAARRLLVEKAPTRRVVAFMVDCGFGPGTARSAVRFAKTYRAYICAYRLGLEIVKGYLGSGPDRIARYREILSRPFTPSGLRAATTQ